VAAYRYDGDRGALTPFQIISSLPQDNTGNSRASEIAVSLDGQVVYASNRGFDSVPVLAVDPETGWLSQVQFASSEGRIPRFFAINPSGHRMYVANQDSDEIVPFDVEAMTSRLIRSGDVIRTGSPVCLLFKSASEGCA
jgi:6-phosphogluconolactonase